MNNPHWTLVEDPDLNSLNFKTYILGYLTKADNPIEFYISR